MGPTSKELPNQLVLQTRHRNAVAKSCTPELLMQQKLQEDLLLRHWQFDRALYQPGMVLLPK